MAATASGGCPNPVYEFWVQYPNGSWNLKRGWDSNAAFDWDTSGLAPGVYTVHSWSNQQGAATTLEVYGTSMVTLTGCTSAALSPANSSQAAGSTVALSETSGGCPNPVYEFWVQYPNGSWNLKQGWSTSASFNWDTSGLAPGVYVVHGWANQQGASPTLEVYGTSTVTLTTCNSAAVTPPSVSQPAGTTVALSASSTGCLSPRYEFWVQYPGGTWYLKQGWSTDGSFNWDTNGLNPGTYTIHAWVNRQGTGHDAIGSATVTLSGCTSSTVSPASGTAAQGTQVSFTASAMGCPNPVYEFWLQDPSGVWHLMQTFGSSATWTWNSSGWAKGKYTIHVWANQQGANAATYETIGNATYTLT